MKFITMFVLFFVSQCLFSDEEIIIEKIKTAIVKSEFDPQLKSLNENLIEALGLEFKILNTGDSGVEFKNKLYFCFILKHKYLAYVKIKNYMSKPSIEDCVAYELKSLDSTFVNDRGVTMYKLSNSVNEKIKSFNSYFILKEKCSLERVLFGRETFSSNNNLEVLELYYYLIQSNLKSQIENIDDFTNLNLNYCLYGIMNTMFSAPDGVPIPVDRPFGKEAKYFYDCYFFKNYPFTVSGLRLNKYTQIRSSVLSFIYFECKMKKQYVLEEFSGNSFCKYLELNYFEDLKYYFSRPNNPVGVKFELNSNLVEWLGPDYKEFSFIWDVETKCLIRKKIDIVIEK